jgi:hypothetical protein
MKHDMNKMRKCVHWWGESRAVRVLPCVTQVNIRDFGQVGI